MTRLRMIRGDDRLITFIVRDGDTPVDLAAFDEMRFTVKRRPEESALISKFIGTGVVATANLGEAIVTLNAADTAGLYGTVTLHWDFELTDEGGKTYTVADGLLEVRADISI